MRSTSFWNNPGALKYGIAAVIMWRPKPAAREPSIRTAPFIILRLLYPDGGFLQSDTFYNSNPIDLVISIRQIQKNEELDKNTARR